MAEYALYRMRLRQENRLAPISVKINKQLALADYRQSLKLNNKNIKEIIVCQDTSRLAPAMQGYYWRQIKELSLRKKDPHFRSLYE